MPYLGTQTINATMMAQRWNGNPIGLSQLPRITHLGPTKGTLHTANKPTVI